MISDSEPSTKVQNGNSNKVQKNVHIFQRNRALGYVSNHIPAVVRYVQRREDNLITTCIGRSFQIYTGSHFRLLHVSEIHPDDITAMAADNLHVYTASNKCIYAWRAGKRISHIYRSHTRNIHLLFPFGDHIIAVDQANILKVWDIKKAEVYLEIPFSSDFLISALAHPPTYLNKIILGSQQGLLKIWNLRENRLIFTFPGYSSCITCIQPAPALDVVAVGHQNGVVVLLNIKFDEILMNLKQDWGSVSQISFRLDGPSIMVTASNSGHLAFWDLEEQKTVSQIKAHEDAVTTACYLNNEPLLLTTSPDNSMKLWIFDMPESGARLLRIREGHTAFPLCIRYHGSSGTTILSSGEDSSLRVFSTISETLNRSMGKATYKLKSSKKKNRFHDNEQRMSPIVQFTSEISREKQWDNIAAIHIGTIQSTTWSFHKNCMGSHRLVPEKFQKKNRADFATETTCLTLSHCGNFVIIGYSSGDLERFNIQSGIHRGSYGNPVAHKAAVRGVVTDNLNQFVASGCSDGILKFWQFKENQAYCKSIIKFGSSVELMRMHRESAVIAVALVSFSVYLIDSDIKIIVRKFEGHSAKINDLTFSPDGRWLITAAMDSTIKVWDIPSSYMVDHFRVECPCLSLSMSPTGDYLATAHVNCLGIYLWTNKMLFKPISLRSISPHDLAPCIDLPSNAGDTASIEQIEEEYFINEEQEAGEEVDTIYKTPLQLSSDLITMSSVAVSHWQNLLDLDVIKKRNKPNVLHKIPKAAPFFLPTIAGLPFKFDTLSPARTNGNSRMFRSSLKNLTDFGRMLADSTMSTDYEKCVNHLKQLGPSMIDMEIKSLNPLNGGSGFVMIQFLKVIEFMFSTNTNFELAQSYLSVYLQTHGMTLIKCPNILKTVARIVEVQKQTWKRIEYKLMFGIGVASLLRNFSI